MAPMRTSPFSKVCTSPPATARRQRRKWSLAAPPPTYWIFVGATKSGNFFDGPSPEGGVIRPHRITTARPYNRANVGSANDSKRAATILGLGAEELRAGRLEQALRLSIDALEAYRRLGRPREA